MATPIIFIYAVGLLFLIFGIESIKEKGIMPVLYLGMAAFVNWMGYYISYTDPDYTLFAYFPLILLVVGIVLLIYTVWGMIPIGASWDEDAEKETD